KAALRDAKLQAQDISYIEAHGTGTKLGDPIEIEAIASVYGPDVEVVIGSSKANFGHLEAAAGILGLFASLVVLRSSTAYGNAQLKSLNKSIAEVTAGKRVRISSEAVPLDSCKAVGVSSFGYSGTLAHVILVQPMSNARSLTDIPPIASARSTLVAALTPAINDSILYPITTQDTLNNQILYRFPISKTLRCLLQTEYEFRRSIAFSIWDILHAAFIADPNVHHAVCIEDLTFTDFQLVNMQQLTLPFSSVWVSIDLSSCSGSVWLKLDRNPKYLLATFSCMQEISQVDVDALCKKFIAVKSHSLSLLPGWLSNKGLGQYTVLAQSLHEAFNVIDSNLELSGMMKTIISRSKCDASEILQVSFIVKPNSNLVDILCRKSDDSLLIAIYGATIKIPKLSHKLLIEEWVERSSAGLGAKTSFDLSMQVWFADHDDQSLLQDEVISKLPKLSSVDELFGSSVKLAEQVVISGNSLYKLFSTGIRKADEVAKLVRTKLFPLIEMTITQNSRIVFVFSELTQSQKTYFTFSQFRDIISNLSDCAKLEGTESSVSVVVMDKTVSINTGLMAIEANMKTSVQFTGVINASDGLMRSKGLKLLPSSLTVKSNFKAEIAIITGGLGGLGLLTAKVLVKLGARHLFLVSRSGKIAYEGQ
ncbi:KR domain-containing protein, partial [archaeon]